MKKILTLTLVALFAFTASAHALKTNEAAPDFTLTDTNGTSHSLSDFKGKYVVLEWVNFDCPFVKKFYTPGAMQKWQKEFTEKGVVWLSINSSAVGKQGSYNAQEVNEIIGNAGAAPTAYLLDTDGKVGKTYKAKTTPHMYIIDPEGMLIYQGAIDDTASANPGDIAKSENYVAKALAQAMSGQAVSPDSTKSYGCSVKY